MPPEDKKATDKIATETTTTTTKKTTAERQDEAHRGSGKQPAKGDDPHRTTTDESEA